MLPKISLFRAKAMSSPIPYGILGGGPAGLTLSHFLRERSEVLETLSTPGGHAASFQLDGFTFDYGPHIMFSKHKDILGFMIESLQGNVHECRRNNKISFKGRLTKYPFENGLSGLPLDDNFACVRDFFINPYKDQCATPKNLKEWLLAQFGAGICDRYLFPYNEKVWNIPVEQLSMLWADRIPNPAPEDILKSSLGIPNEGYLHQLYYHYPRTGGYQALSNMWSQGAPVIYDYEITRIEKRDGLFYVSNSEDVRCYNQLISTLPVQKLLHLTNLEIPQQVRQAVDALIVHPMWIISLGIRGTDSEKMTAVYFPEAEYLVNRISFPATFSPQNAPEGCYSIQAEITCRPNSDTWSMEEDKILQHVVDGMIERNIIQSWQDIICHNVCRRTYSYVVYDLAYEKNTSLIREWFSSQNLHLAGRFGFFEYANVDGIIWRNLQLAEKLNGHPVMLKGRQILK